VITFSSADYVITATLPTGQPLQWRAAHCSGKTESWNAHLATWPVWLRSTWDHRGYREGAACNPPGKETAYQVRVLVTVGLRSFFRFRSIILHHLPVASINQRILWHLHHVFFFFWGGRGWGVVNFAMWGKFFLKIFFRILTGVFFVLPSGRRVWRVAHFAMWRKFFSTLFFRLFPGVFSANRQNGKRSTVLTKSPYFFYTLFKQVASLDIKRIWINFYFHSLSIAKRG